MAKLRGLFHTARHSTLGPAFHSERLLMVTPLFKPHRYAVRALLAVLLTVATSSVSRADTPLNLLFLGNSFTAGGPIAHLVRDLATDAGWATPNVQYVAPGGQTLGFHTTNPDTVNAIGLGGWDYVVLQEYSTGPTDNAGNPAAFKSNATSLYDQVKLSSPSANVVLYETWAREASHSIYPGTFTDPAQMQAQLRTHYNDAADNYIPANSTATVTTDVSVAPAGDAWENYLDSGGTIRLHANDDYHAGNNGQYLSSAVIYSTIYERSVAGLSSLLASPADATVLQSFADSTTGMTVTGGPAGNGLSPLAGGAEFLIDFGGDGRPTAAPWNNFTASGTGSSLINLVDDSGLTTSVDVTLTDGFSGVNSAGSSTNTVGLPTTATSDSFYTGSFGGHDDALLNRAQVTFSGLDPSLEYDLSLFSSRTGTDSGMGRLTRYTVDGQWIDFDVSNNTGTEVQFVDLSVAADGTLTLDVEVSPDGTGRFAYLGALKLTAQAIPEPSGLVLLGAFGLQLMRRPKRRV